MFLFLRKRSYLESNRGLSQGSITRWLPLLNPKVDLDLDCSYNKLREKFPATGFGGRPTLSEAGFDLLNKMLTYDPNKVLTAETRTTARADVTSAPDSQTEA